ncbi:MAG: Macrolide export ATP-binding/permease protein MacB [Parcubacteria group bacterium ADurb.Bin216]|nr:MAG: Macrolide export ATP-binding/permease protein MacB [Parcubacteria group bacterium ADurb.Bin216]
MSRILKYFQVAYNNLIRQKTRTFLTVFAMAIGIASLVVIITASENFKESITGQLDIYSPNSINIEVRVPGNKGVAAATGINITTFKNSDIDAIKRIDNVDKVYGYLTAQEVIKNETGKETALIFGYGAEAGEIEKMDFIAGRYYTVEEENSLTPVVVIGKKINDNLFGDNDAINKTVYVKGKPYKVIGVLASKGANFGFDMDKVIYIPAKVVQKKILGVDYVLGAMATTVDTKRIDQTKEDIIEVMRDRHEIEDESRDDFEVMTMKEASDMVNTILSGVAYFLMALVGISLLVAGVGITNIMYVTVVERTFEIGLRMAVGARKGDILWQFIAETMILTFAGGVLGVTIGVGIAYLIYYLAIVFDFSWSPIIPLWVIVFSLSFSTVIGLFFGVYPARLASNLDPIDAIRKD